MAIHLNHVWVDRDVGNKRVPAPGANQLIEGERAHYLTFLRMRLAIFSSMRLSSS